MRYFYAILSLIVSAVLIVLAVGQRSFIAPDEVYSTSVSYSGEGKEIVVIPSSIFSKKQGKAKIQAESESEILSVYGTDNDIKAWSEGFDHEEIVLNNNFKIKSEKKEKDMEAILARFDVNSEEAEKRLTENINNAINNTTSPSGNDMWIYEEVNNKSYTNSVTLKPDTSIILYSDLKNSAIKKVIISWEKEYITPWFGPLMLGGIILLLLGLFLLIKAWDNDRRKLGPQRGVNVKFAGFRRKKVIKTINSDEFLAIPKNIIKIASVILALSILSACTPSSWPTASTFEKLENQEKKPKKNNNDSSIADPVVTTIQLQKIINNISDNVIESDKEKDLEKLATRYSGPAYVDRESWYKISQTVPDAEIVDAPSAKLLNYSLVQNTEQWPRTIFSVVENYEGENVQPIALTLNQLTPFNNYKVSHQSLLMAGAKLPDAAPPEEGTVRFAPDYGALALEPEKISEAYADVLNLGQESEFYNLFDLEEDEFYKNIGLDSRKAQAEALAQSGQEGKIEFKTEPGSLESITLSTINSGAIVINTVLDTQKILPTNQRAEVSFESKSAEALAGKNKSKTGLYQTWQSELIFSVPAEGKDEKIKLLGYSYHLVKAGEV